MHDKFQRLLAFVAVAIVSMFGVVAVQSPALAAWSDCPSGYFCMWTGQNATGSRYQWSYNTIMTGTNNGRRLTSSPINNISNSWYNRSSAAVIIFDANNCSVNSWYRQMNNGQSATSQGSDWGNKVSSIQLWNASPLTC